MLAQRAIEKVNGVWLDEEGFAGHVEAGEFCEGEAGEDVGEQWAPCVPKGPRASRP